MADEAPAPQYDDENVEVQYKSVDNLSDIKTAAGARPDPITLTWRAGGERYKLVLQTRYPKDPDTFGHQYLEHQEKANEPEYDKDGKATFPNAGAHELFLRRELIEGIIGEDGSVKNPGMMHNKSAFKEFCGKVPPQIPAILHRKLRLIGSLDADFFIDFQDYTAPVVQRILSMQSESDSESSPKTSEPATEPKTEESTGDESPPSPTTTGSEGTKSESTESSTTSGSEPSATPTATKSLRPRPIPSTD